MNAYARDHTFRMPANARRRHLVKDHAGQYTVEVWSARLARPMSESLSVVVRNLHKFVHEKSS